MPQSERIAAAERATTAQQRFAKEQNLKLAGSRKTQIQAADGLGPSSQQSTESSGSDFIPDKAPPARSAAKFRTAFLGLKRKATDLPTHLPKESKKQLKSADKLGKKTKPLQRTQNQCGTPNLAPLRYVCVQQEGKHGETWYLKFVQLSLAAYIVTPIAGNSHCYVWKTRSEAHDNWRTGGVG